MPRHGEKTGAFGKWLYDYCKEYHRDLTVYYDHGEKLIDPNVCVPMGFNGIKVLNKNRLTDVDILVGRDDKKAKLLIEVEQSLASPKTVLGDLLATLMCNKFAIKKDKYHDYYEVCEKTHLMLAFPYKEKGYSKEKMANIAKRLPQLGGFKDGLPTSNIELVMAPNLEATLEKLKERTIQLLSAKNPN